MIQITMKHLRYFETLSQHGHFGRAAAASAISQPALSLQMKELEQILGAPLIERGTRQIRLTRLGEAFALRARDILRALGFAPTAKPKAGEPVVWRRRGEKAQQRPEPPPSPHSPFAALASLKEQPAPARRPRRRRKSKAAAP